MTEHAVVAINDVSPFSTPRELLTHQVRAVRARLTAVKQHVKAAPESLLSLEWPSEVRTLDEGLTQRVAKSDPGTLPMLRLRTHLRLRDTEERILWILVSHTVCRFCRGLVRALNTEDVTEATTDVLGTLVYEPCEEESWSEFLATAPLRRHGLIERTDGGAATPIERQTWRATDRVIALAYGNTDIDPQLSPLIPSSQPVGFDLEVAGDVLGQIRNAIKDERIVVVHGPAGYGRRSCLEQVLRASDRRPLVIDGHAISKDRGDAARELRALGRECCLFSYAPLIRNLDALAGSGEIPDRLDLVESELGGLVAATASNAIARSWTRRAANIEVRRLPTPRLATLWQRVIPTLTAAQALDYAGRFPIAPAMIYAVGAQVSSASPSEEEIKGALRSIVASKLGALAKRVGVTHAWEDLVLPEDQMAGVMALLSRIQLRSKVLNDWGFAADPDAKGVGVAALFSGPPGTGKTMAAGLIAHALGAELYQVDISRIISKWIGETEKNLAAIFDAAEAGHAVLLFDEADSLFGKRTEVKTSNDRHANAETNYLLQRIELFGGIVLLTTNHETAIDPAFKRRLTQHVRFPMPEIDERRKLWKVMIPKKAPTAGDMRFDSLAQRYEMSGGNIHNAVQRAAFLAAATNKPIDATFLEQGARLEYEDEMGKIPPSRM